MTCFAQGDDPFGSPAPSAGAPSAVALPSTASPANNAPPLPPDDNAVVQSLRNDPPRTPIELGRAVLYMSRIERWKEAGRYLDALRKADLDEAATSRIIRSTGLDLWLRLENRVDDFTAEQRDFARKLFNTSSEYFRSDAILTNAIANLNVPELVNRKRGVLALQSAGDAGLSAVLQSVAKSDRAPALIASELIATMNPSGEESLQAALTISETKAKLRLLQLAARVPGGGLMTELIAALHWPELNDETREFIMKAVSPAGGSIPSMVSTRRLLADRIRTGLDEYLALQAKPKLDIETVWRWSNDEKSLTSEVDDLRDKKLERAYQLATHWLAMPTSLGQDDAMAVAVVMERAYRLDPVFESQASTEFRLNAVSDRLPPAWDFAWKEELFGAQLRMLQVLPAMLKKTDDSPREVWLTRLQQAVESPAPAVRYQAALTLKRLSDSFSGSATRLSLQRAQAEILKLEGKSLALVIGGSAERRDVLSKQLGEMGMRSLHAGNVRDAMRLIQEDQPIEFVFVVDRVTEMRLSELIQRLRSHPRIAKLPMAIVVDSQTNHAAGLLETEAFSDLTRGVLTVKSENTAIILNEMLSRSPLPPLDAIDRVMLRAAFDSTSDNTTSR